MRSVIIDGFIGELEETMPIGYFVTVALVASCTALALWPMSRPRLLAKLSFVFAVVVNELPHVAFLLLLASTLLAIGQDGLLDTTSGWAVATLAGLTTLGLAVLARRALAARRVVDTAVGGGLGVHPAGTSVEAPRSRAAPPCLAAGATRAIPVPPPPRGADRQPPLRRCGEAEPPGRLPSPFPPAASPDAVVLPRGRLLQRQQEPGGAARFCIDLPVTAGCV